MSKKKYTQEGPTLFDNIPEEASKNRASFVELDENKALIRRSMISSKLLSVATSLRKQAEGINTEVHGNWTHRRQSFADNARSKKNRLLEDANVFEALSILWNANQCPRILQGIRSRSDLDTYYPTPPSADHGKWYHEEYPMLLKKATKLGITSKEESEEFKRHIKELRVHVINPEDKKKRDIQDAITAIRGKDIPGFFPTPDDVIDTMLEYACIEENMSILEPSAGIGSIVDRIVSSGYSYHITCVEKHHSLAEILRLKGYPCHCCDILEYEPPRGESGIPYGFDRIVMNPPFEKGQDMEHVMYCYDYLLKKGGTLVSVMSAGVMNNSTKKYVEFREWVEKEAGVFIDLGQAFKNSFRNTGVSVVILMIEK